MEQPEKKRMGRPPKNPALGTLTAAQRKQQERFRQAARLDYRTEHEWTEADCLRALARPLWRGTPLARAAWEKLGKLHGYL